MKTPTKIQAIKNLFKGDEDYQITDGCTFDITGKPIKSITIWWEEEKKKHG